MEPVRAPRALLLSNASVGTTLESALAAFRERYPGTSSAIEQVIVWDWSRDPWAMTCETIHFKPGDLKRFWPATIKPIGPIHFVGAYADNMWWGQEAATRSANRVAEVIDKT
jgi:monoamine oxidase